MVLIEQPETFWTLLHNSAHWQFELFVGGVEMLLVDGLIGLLAWPYIKKHWGHHLERDRKEAASSGCTHTNVVSIGEDGLWLCKDCLHGVRLVQRSENQWDFKVAVKEEEKQNEAL